MFKTLFFSPRKIIIRLPGLKTAPKKPTQPILKEVHHHHKPSIIKEEKIIKQEIHKFPHKFEKEIEHEHVHHHYKHEHTH